MVWLISLSIMSRGHFFDLVKQEIFQRPAFVADLVPKYDADTQYAPKCNRLSGRPLFSHGMGVCRPWMLNAYQRVLPCVPVGEVRCCQSCHSLWFGCGVDGGRGRWRTFLGRGGNQEVCLFKFQNWDEVPSPASSHHSNQPACWRRRADPAGQPGTPEHGEPSSGRHQRGRQACGGGSVVSTMVQPYDGDPAARTRALLLVIVSSWAGLEVSRRSGRWFTCLEAWLLALREKTSQNLINRNVYISSPR